MKRIIGGLFLVGLVVISSPVAASDKPFSFSIGGGIATPVGGVGESLGSGGQVTIGAGFKVQTQITVFGEYNFSSLADKVINVPQPLITDAESFSGNGWYQYGGGGVTFTPWQSGKSSVYVLGGAGVYYRSVYVTTPATGLVDTCPTRAPSRRSFGRGCRAFTEESAASCRSSSTPAIRPTAARSASRWKRWGCPTTCIP